VDRKRLDVRAILDLKQKNWQTRELCQTFKTMHKLSETYKINIKSKNCKSNFVKFLSTRECNIVIVCEI